MNQSIGWSSASSFASVYPSYDPNEFQLDPVPLSAPTLPPVPAAYMNLSTTELHVTAEPYVSMPPSVTPPPRKNNPVRLIYTKSGFYLKSTNPMANDSIHGFFAIFSKSMVNDNDPTLKLFLI